MSNLIDVPLTTETLKAIKEAAQSVYDFDPDTDSPFVVGGGMVLSDLLNLMSGSLGAEGTEDGIFAYIDVPTITKDELIVALVEEIERLRGIQ